MAPGALPFCFLSSYFTQTYAAQPKAVVGITAMEYLDEWREMQGNMLESEM
jgi:hypothetical protein